MTTFRAEKAKACMRVIEEEEGEEEPEDQDKDEDYW